MLGRTNLVALVGGGQAPKFPDRNGNKRGGGGGGEGLKGEPIQTVLLEWASANAWESSSLCCCCFWILVDY